MKKPPLLLCSLLLLQVTYGQTNIFPASGNVGIGTSNPIQALHIKASSGTIYDYLESGQNFFGIGIHNLDQFGPSMVFSENSQLRIGFASSILASGAVDFMEVMRIDNNGFVGIGTSTPQEKLSVNGHIRAQAIKVETTNWPDYVFEKGHRLLSLKELSSYIQQHKHLPGIPTEAEVKREGVDLGEMNARLLEKIEELTLHIIEQDQRLQKLENGLATKENRAKP